MRAQKVFDGQRHLIIFIFVVSMFINLLVLTAPLYMLQLFSRVMSSGSMATLAMLTVGAAIALFFFFAFDVIRQKLVARLGTRLESRLGSVVLSGLVRGVTLGQETGGQPIRDLQDIRNFLTGPSFVSLLDAPWSPVFVGIIFIFHPVLGWVAAVGIAILFLFGVIGELTGRNPARDATEAAQTANRFVEEILRNAETARSMGKIPALIDRWWALSGTSMVQGILVTDRIALLTSLAKLTRLALQIALLGIGVLYVLKGELAPGVMIASSILLGRAAAPVEQSIAGWRALTQARISVKRLNNLMARLVDAGAQMELPNPVGNISVENATVVVPERQNPLIFDVSFELKPGDSLGIIGPSAAGKTSLVRALVGLQPLARGYIRIDDAALTDWPQDQIGRHVGFLPQRVEMFDGTVAENIAMMDSSVTPELIVEAAKRARSHELILALPGGYNAQVGFRGERLSAGQRQRLGLARTFLGDRKLLVMDEPNANLDMEGEEALKGAVEDACARGCVVVVVTHRMKILQGFSHAAVMSEGRMIRFGESRSILQALVQPMAQSTSEDPKVAVLRRQNNKIG